MRHYKKNSRRGFVLFLFFLLLLSAVITFYYLWPWRSVDPVLQGESENYGVYCVGEIKADSCYWFDNKGVVWGEAKTIVGESIFKIQDISDFKVVRGQAFLVEELVGDVFKILDFLRGEYLKVEKINLKRDDRELHAIVLYQPTRLKTKILFSMHFDPKNNLAGLMEFLNKYKPKELEYIDLRVENKIFYR